MIHWKYILIALLLSACGQQPSETNDNHGLGFDFDEQSDVTGIRVKLANDDSFNADELDTMYAEVAECMNIETLPTPGPLVIYRENFTRDFGNSDFNVGRTYTDTLTIVVDAGQSRVPPPTFPDVQTGADRTTRHEMIHFLLKATTGDADVRHTSPFFEFGPIDCAEPRSTNVQHH